MYDDDRNHTTSRLADGITGPVIAPLLQALVTGLLAGIFGSVLSTYLRPNDSAWKAFLLVWTMATLVSWLAYRSRWQYVIERILMVDLDGDGQVGEPVQIYTPPPPQPLRVVISQREGNELDYLDLPYADRLPQLAAGLIEGRTFKQESFSFFSRPEFDRLRDEMINRNLAKWKNERAHAQGVELTAKGRAVMKGITSTTPTPPRGV